MRTILVLSLHCSKWGAERSMCSALYGLKQRGFRIIVIISQQGGIEELLQEYGLEYYISELDSATIGYTPSFRNRVRWLLHDTFSVWKNNRKIIKLLDSKKIHPDIIYTNTILPINGIITIEVII